MTGQPAVSDYVGKFRSFIHWQCLALVWPTEFADSEPADAETSITKSGCDS